MFRDSETGEDVFFAGRRGPAVAAHGWDDERLSALGFDFGDDPFQRFQRAACTPAAGGDAHPAPVPDALADAKLLEAGANRAFHVVQLLPRQQLPYLRHPRQFG